MRGPGISVTIYMVSNPMSTPAIALNHLPGTEVTDQYTVSRKHGQMKKQNKVSAPRPPDGRRGVAKPFGLELTAERQSPIH